MTVEMPQFSLMSRLFNNPQLSHDWAL